MPRVTYLSSPQSLPSSPAPSLYTPIYDPLLSPRPSHYPSPPILPPFPQPRTHHLLTFPILFLEQNESLVLRHGYCTPQSGKVCPMQHGTSLQYTILLDSHFLR